MLPGKVISIDRDIFFNVALSLLLDGYEFSSTFAEDAIMTSNVSFTEIPCRPTVVVLIIFVIIFYYDK